MDALRRLTRTQLLVAIVATVLVAELFANVVDVGDDDAGGPDYAAWLGLSAWGIAVGSVIVLYVLPRVREPGTVGLVLALTALATVIAFWSALPFALGIPALHLAALASGRESTTGQVAAGIAGAAIIAALVLCVVG